MKEKDRFQSIRKQKVKLSLRTRMTLLMAVIMFCSISIAYGLHMLVNWIVPASSYISVHIQLNAFSLIVAIIATMFLSKIFFKPIKLLNEGMQKVADGDFNTRITTKSSSLEIQEMFAGFNMMVKELGSTEILQTDFVSNVSHEFKTPINAIEGYTTLLQGCDNLNKDQEEYVEKILFNTKRLSTLVSNILLLSKIENQSIQTHKEPYGLDEQIRESIVGLESAWESKEIELDVDLDDIEYNGNELMMRHVWNNLISNAVKFSPRGGMVKIRLRDKDDSFVFTIEDQGPGFSEETKKHLFDKFYQEDTSHKEEGNGLGLALVKRILAIEDGKIFAENIDSGGCRFTVILNKKQCL